MSEGKKIKTPGKIGLSIGTEWNLDAFIEEGEIMIEVCKRIRDKKHHNKRCCMNCIKLGTIRTLRCDTCDKISVFTIKRGDPINREYECQTVDGTTLPCKGKYIESNVPNKSICLDAKVRELFENPMEFDIEGDVRIFVCPFFKFSDSVTNNVKYEELKKCLE